MIDDEFPINVYSSVQFFLLEMNENSVNDGVITVEHSLVAQHPHADNHQRENSTQNQSNSEEIVKVLNKKKISPMNPTPLYISLYSS
jgi:hypothetical protein